MLPLVAPESPGYARGPFFASTVLSVILTPIAVEAVQRVFGEGEVLHVSPLAVTEVVIGSVLIPLGIGLAIGRWRPAARRWVAAIQRVSGIVPLICAIPIIVAAWSVMASVVREGTLTAIICITLIGLATGHLLGGPLEDDRTVLAFATVTRHPGTAVAIAGFTDQKLAPVGVLLAVLVGEFAVIPYKVWRKRRRRAAAGAARHGTRSSGGH